MKAADSNPRPNKSLVTTSFNPATILFIQEELFHLQTFLGFMLTSMITLEISLTRKEIVYSNNFRDFLSPQLEEIKSLLILITQQPLKRVFNDLIIFNS